MAKNGLFLGYSEVCEDHFNTLCNRIQFSVVQGCERNGSAALVSLLIFREHANYSS